MAKGGGMRGMGEMEGMGVAKDYEDFIILTWIVPNRSDSGPGLRLRLGKRPIWQVESPELDLVESVRWVELFWEGGWVNPRYFSRLRQALLVVRICAVRWVGR